MMGWKKRSSGVNPGDTLAESASDAAHLDGLLSPSLLLILAGLVLTILASLGFASFHRAADTSRRLEVLITHLESHTHALNALEWEAAAQGRVTPELTTAIDATLTLMRDRIETLRAEDRRSGGGDSLNIAFTAYAEAISSEFQRLARGQREAAAEVDEAHVDPAYDDLLRQVGLAGEHYRREAARLAGVANSGSLIAMLLGVLAVAALTWGVHDARRRTSLTAAEQRVRVETERRVSALLKLSSDATLVVSPEGRVLFASAAAGRLLPGTPASLAGRGLADFVHPDDMTRLADMLTGLRDARRVVSATFRLRGYEAQIRTVEATGTNQLNEPEVRGLIINMRDISDRLKDQAAVQASEERYRLLFERNPQPMWVCERDSLRFLSANDAAVSHYGYRRDRMLRMTLTDLQGEAGLAELRADLTAPPDAPVRVHEARHRRKDGRELDVEISAHPLVLDGRPAALLLAHDVTDRKRMETQLRQAQKMDAVGRLAGGIAHDFNNLLTAISGYGELARNALPAGSAEKGHVEEVLRAAARAADLTRQLLAFSRQQVIEPRVLDVSETVTDIERMLRRLIGETIELTVQPAAEPACVRADPGQVEQIIVNLAVNARDAMPDGGRLTLATAAVAADATFRQQHPELPPGEYIRLAVSDTGCGMDAATRARIFEPFFTTKEVGRGTGLGLATVYGIVRQCGGFIWVVSEPGRGTTFEICLPRVHEAIERPEPAAVRLAEPPATETILLVEDEELVRELVTEILAAQGYRLLTACDGLAALEVAAGHPDPIDLILTDVVMPGLGGRETVEALRETRPDMAVIYMSGYTDDAVVHLGVLDRDLAFLQKPFSHDVLLEKVRSVLAAAAASARKTA